MIQHFFRAGEKRSTPRNNESPAPPLNKENWFGDCAICRTLFTYRNVITIGPIQTPNGGFCYRCRKEYCRTHVKWEKTELKQPGSDEVYDGYNAICPKCNILLNTHQPELKAIDEKLRHDLQSGLDHLTLLIDLLKERGDNLEEIQRLQGLSERIGYDR